MTYKVFTDSASNLPLSCTDGIGIIPWTLTIDGEEEACPTAPDMFDCHTYYEKMRKGAQLKTSLLNSERICEMLRPSLKEGNDIMYLTLSSSVSGTFQSAKVAAEQLLEEFPNRVIRCFDSLGAGLGVGIQALRAHKLSCAGIPIDEAYDILIDERAHMCEYFIVDDLMHLMRGGRISALHAVVGRVLNVKPVLFGSDHGAIETYKKVRGRASAINTIAEVYRDKHLEENPSIVGISHGDCLEDAEKLSNIICSIAKPKQLIIAPHEPLTGAHVGPGMLALFFYGTSR